MNIKIDLLNEKLDLKASKGAVAYDLSVDSLFRALLIKIVEDRYIFSFVMNNIISGAWSFEIVINEILLLYNALLKRFLILFSA